MLLSLLLIVLGVYLAGFLAINLREAPMNIRLAACALAGFGLALVLAGVPRTGVAGEVVGAGYALSALALGVAAGRATWATDRSRFVATAFQASVGLVFMAVVFSVVG